MICTDCNKTFTGSGIRCIRCHDLYEKGKNNKEETTRQIIRSAVDLKTSKRVIFLAAVVALVNAAGAADIWWSYTFNDTPCTHPLLLLLKPQINPILSAVEIMAAFGLFFRSRIAAVLMTLGFCAQWGPIYQKIAERELKIAIPIVLLILLASVYHCFKWHYVKSRFIRTL